jgi:cleavage and polyadenylation specificity factor subunit 1
MGAVLQQRVDNTWQPLAFFSKELNPAQQKYSAYDRELLAVYEAVKHFRHMLETRHFIIFTDHKPITYAFQQKRDKCSPRQFNHLDCITQFTTDIRHISGQDSVVADALSRFESVTAPPFHDALAASQEGDNELRALLASSTALRLERQQIPGTTVSISTSWGLFQRQQATHTALLHLIASRAGQKPFPSRTSQPTPWHTPY